MEFNAYESFHKVIRFERCVPPRWDALGFWSSTVARWRTEGLPEDQSPEQYFGITPRPGLPVVSGFCSNPYWPAFEEVTIEETETARIWRDGQGILKRDRKDSVELSMPQFLEFPVKARCDWEEIKFRLDPSSPGRYPDWQKMHEQFDNREYPLGLYITGAYGFPRNLMGEERLAYTYYDDPELIRDMEETWMRFYVELAERVCRNFQVDYVMLWEDMAFKNGPLISPRMFKEFMSPYYKEVVGQFKRLHVPCVMVDSDGDNRPILDLFVETGIDAFLPFEIAANMEPLEIREKYPNLVIMGGIDKRALAKDKAAIEHEVMRKAPKMLEVGGYIPGVDHSVPHDVPFENYAHYTELIRKITAEYAE